MGNGLWRSKTSGQKTILSGCTYHRCCNILLVTVLAGIAVVDMLFHNHPCGNDFQLVDNFFSNLRQLSTALGADQFLSFQPVLNLFYRNILWDFVQRVFMLFVTLMGSYNGHIFLVPLFFRKHFRFVKQKAQLLGECVLALFRRRTETLALRKAQCLHEHVHTTLKLRNTSALSLKFLIFRPGNSNGFRGACLERICLFYGMIIPYKCRKVQKNDPFYTISNPLICLCAFGWSMLSPSMSQRYCCMVRALASLSFRGHWKMPDSKRL